MEEIELTGKVITEEFGKGSKSFHDAIYLDVGDKKYRLKMKGGNPFYDPELHKYIGKTVKIIGTDMKHYFVISAKPKIIVKRKKSSG